MHEKIICFGEMLWDILPSGVMPGGAPMNVAVHFNYNGFSPAIISRIGDDLLGKSLVERLQEKGVATRYIQIDEKHPTSVVKANIGNKRDVVYEIAPSVAWDYIEYDEQVTQLISKCDLFIYGSLASRNKITYDTLLKYLLIARVKVFDVNMRPPHYSPKLIQLLMNHADIVKMNERELIEIMSWFGKIAPHKEAMTFIKQRFELDKILVSRGEKGAILLCEEGYIEHSGYQVEIEDTIGSGDAFLAAFLSKILQKAPIREAMEFACATGALVATKSGALPQFTQNEIKNFIHEQRLLKSKSGEKKS
ncbi:carbohydrate kinase [Rhodocytophaga rosea]|uniref:Carbohydrate kinase n=1 Tax=Rhodocytophaga rosea TaxID=2704465 RepID=A0A6C0GSL1_9BACT|nr:carbohydrate kinase [Rhodocytophaga rosea]QHT71115.1 carbohydrate kinase [Rhodocytophaga rosea]